jgi:hypothetical protein
MYALKLTGYKTIVNAGGLTTAMAESFIRISTGVFSKTPEHLEVIDLQYATLFNNLEDIPWHSGAVACEVDVDSEGALFLVTRYTFDE